MTLNIIKSLNGCILNKSTVRVWVIFRFGNCHQNGGVKFFYNGKEIVEAAPKTVKMYNLKFSNGTTIELRQNGGIIRFDYFYVVDCGKYLLKILILN